MNQPFEVKAPNSDQRLLQVGLIPTGIVLVAYFVSLFFEPQLVLRAPRFDSILDGIGAYMALNLSVLLYFTREHFEGESYEGYSWACAALASIGVLKMSCAMSDDISSSLLHHVFERLLGSSFFAAAWWIKRNSAQYLRFLAVLPLIALVLSSLIGFFILVIPSSYVADGIRISLWLKIPTVISGILFFVAYVRWEKKAVLFDVRYVTSLDSLFLFYAASSILYPFTYLWGPRWWLVRLLELAPFIIAFYEKIRIYSNVQGKLIRAQKSLSVSNKKLEHFAYMASHDLQEPLRTIQSFLTLIERRNKSMLDEKSREFMDFCRDAASRMRTYIIDLLNYTRIDSFEKPARAIDGQEILKQVESNMRVTISSIKINIIHDPFPYFYIPQSHLLLLFQNIISNAIKYRNQNRSLEIIIRCKKEPSQWILSFSDNGIGFDPDQSEQIFEMFHRAHGGYEYCGAGIGLASCKKIIESWSGKIWAHSSPEAGSTFFIAIPASYILEKRDEPHS